MVIFENVTSDTIFDQNHKELRISNTELQVKIKVKTHKLELQKNARLSLAYL